MTTSPRRPSPAGLVAAVFGLFVAWPFVAPGRWVTSFDGVAYTGAQATVTFESIRSWALPQWNDLLFGGSNHLGNPQTTVFYPVMWVVAHLDTHRGLLVATAFHIGVLGLGAWVLLRHRLRFVGLASAAGTITILGSGVVVSRAVQHEQIAAMAWIPWLLVTTDLVLDADRPRRATALLVAATAALVMAGHPQQVYLAAPLIVVWTVGRAVDRGAVRRIPLVVLGGVLGLGIAAVQLLPVVAALGDAARTDGASLVTVRAEAYNVQPEHLPLSLLGDVGASSHAVALQSIESVGYVGAVAAALAVLGATTMARKGGDRATAGLLVITVAVAVWLSLGPAAGLYRVLYEVVPGFDQARTPARWLLVALLATTVLAAGALDRLVRAHVDRTEAIVTTVVAGLGLAIAVLAPFTRPSGWGTVGWVLATLGVVAAAWVTTSSAERRTPAAAARRAGTAAMVLATLLVVELGWMQTHSESRAALADESFTARADRVDVPVPDEPGWTLSLADERFGDPDYLVRTLRPNANVLVDRASVDGYDGGPAVTARWVDAVSALTWRPFDVDLTLRAQTFNPVDPGVAARLGIRWLVLETEGRPPESYVPEWGRPAAVEGSIHVYENPRWVGPARLVGRTVPRVERRDDIADQLVALADDTVAVDDPDLTTSVACTEDCAPRPLDVLREGRGEVRVAVPADIAADRLLVVEQQFHRGWSATVDGERRPLVEVDRLLTGVVVRPGDEVVVMTFRAPGRTTGLVLSLAAVAATLALAVGPDVLSRRSTQSRSRSMKGGERPSGAAAPTSGEANE